MGALRAGSIVVVLAAGLVVAASATAARATGDRCKAYGNAGSYTLDITVPRDAPLQGSLAFVTPGTSISNLDVPGGDGTPSTTGLPAGASAQWVYTGGAANGLVTVTLETTGAVRGTITVDPSGRTAKTRYASFSCPLVVGSASHAFALHAQAAYDATAHLWDESVSVPGSGTLEFVEVYTASGAPLVTRGALPATLIEPGLVNVARAGTVELELHPSAAGLAVLHRTGSVAIYLSVSFRPNGGLAATKVLRLVLHG